jgi:anti-sigma regulatory factor (Ser/Thr protein kinase)
MLPPIFSDDALQPPLGAAIVRDFRDRLLERALQAGVAQEQAWKLVAAADEWVSNMEEHGNAGQLRITAELPHGREPLRLRLMDNGRGFDIVASAALAEGPDPKRNRGLGLWMIRQAARGLRRGRTASGENETILEF